MGFPDAHIHPTEPMPRETYPDLGDAELLFGCTAKESEWDRMRGIDDPRVVRFYGVHPWYADGWTADAADALRDLLDSDAGACVGEIGLDSRRGASNQIGAFEEQLAIAEEFGRPVNVHCVGSEKVVIDALSRHRRIPHVIVHAFSNESYAIPLVRLGCHLSVNPRVLARSDMRVCRLMRSIPGDRLLLESDAPFTPGFSGMTDFSTRLASVIGTDADDLMGMALRNARSIL